MREYKVTTNIQTEQLEEELNRHAKEGWVIHTLVYKEAIYRYNVIMERKVHGPNPNRDSHSAFEDDLPDDLRRQRDELLARLDSYQDLPSGV